MKFSEKIKHRYCVVAADDGKIRVYSIVFMQNDSDRDEMARELGVKDAADADDQDIFKYLQQWQDSDLKHHDSDLHDAKDLGTEFLGYVVDDEGKRVPSSQVAAMPEGYLLSRNDRLGYYGLAWFVREPAVTAKTQVVASYKIEPLTKQEYATLRWLAARGYDGDILKLTKGGENDDGTYEFDPIPEHVAWEIQQAIEEDPEAFLSCNGSQSLADKIHKFLDAIV